MTMWTIRVQATRQVIGTVESFAKAREIARCLTERGIGRDRRQHPRGGRP